MRLGEREACGCLVRTLQNLEAEACHLAIHVVELAASVEHPDGKVSIERTQRILAAMLAQVGSNMADELPTKLALIDKVHTMARDALVERDGAAMMARGSA